MRVLMVTPGELSRDPRGRRAALAARAHGHDVVGLCADGESPTDGLEGLDVVRIRSGRVSSALRRTGLGGMRPSPPVVRELRGIYRLLRLGRLTLRLARAGRRLGSFDVVHGHDVDALPATWLIARQSHAGLVYDAHELYADQEPDPPRIYRAALGVLERALAQRASAVVTVSEPIADELTLRFALTERPAVVLNCPSREEHESPSPRTGALRAIYQGAMGPGRMLDDLLAAAEHAPSVELTLRVANADLESIRRELQRRSLTERVEVVEPVDQAHLVQALHPYEVGLIINRPVSRNNELVFPNKLFEYMMAGLAVVAPRLPGLAPLVEGERIGMCFEPGNPSDLASVLERLAADREAVSAMGTRARRLALDSYNAETQATELARVWRTARRSGA